MYNLFIEMNSYNIYLCKYINSESNYCLYFENELPPQLIVNLKLYIPITCITYESDKKILQSKFISEIVKAGLGSVTKKNNPSNKMYYDIYADSRLILEVICKSAKVINQTELSIIPEKKYIISPNVFGTIIVSGNNPPIHLRFKNQSDVKL